MLTYPSHYFTRAAEVETSEEHFNIDEYSDVTQVSKPVIYIAPYEIYYTHLVSSVLPPVLF